MASLAGSSLVCEAGTFFINCPAGPKKKKERKKRKKKNTFKRLSTTYNAYSLTVLLYMSRNILSIVDNRIKRKKENTNKKNKLQIINVKYDI